jgi:dihydropteroate synthase
MSVPAPIVRGDRTLSFERPLLMGVVNVTPDSFSDGGQLANVPAAVQRAEALAASGAAIVDIGGESTRPGADPVDAATEVERVVPVVTALRARGFAGWISVDTSKAPVARAALTAGADMVNDVTALADDDMAATVGDLGAALMVMHMRGTPRTMQEGEITYDNVVASVSQALAAAVERAVDAGVAREQVLIDPGIGFGKTVMHNLTLTRELRSLHPRGHAIVYGPSRKSFLGAVTGREVGDRDRATAAACALAVMAGAHVLRVHDVSAVADAVAVAAAMRDAP